jgi:hypothetical protein
MAGHDIQFPLCTKAFEKNDAVHETLFRKNDTLREDFTNEKVSKAREMAELQTKVLIYSTIGSAVASATMLAFVALVLYVIQTKLIK